MIAAIEGHACAGGLGVALFCDIRIVDDTAIFGVFSRRWGVPMSDGTTVRLPRIVGQGRALDMLLTGRAVGADEAIAIGLATRKVARGTTRAEAEKLAHQIAGFPPIAMTSDRQSAYESFDRDQQAAIRREMELSLEARRKESQKGAARFAEGEGRHGNSRGDDARVGLPCLRADREPQDRGCAEARARGGRDPGQGRRRGRELRRHAGHPGQAPEQAGAALRAGQRDRGRDRGSGEGVTELKVGQRIATGGSRGGFAEYCVTIAANAVPIPDSMPYAEATNFPTLYPTAYGALKWKADLQPGEVLLVHGAGGGSGLTGIEVGKAMGATVIASAGGADKLTAAKDAGADHLIDYRKEDMRARVLELTGGRGADVIYDPVGGDAFDVSLRCVAPEGRLIPMGFASGTIPQIPANILLVKNVTVIGFYYGWYNGWGGKAPPTPKEAGGARQAPRHGGGRAEGADALVRRGQAQGLRRRQLRSRRLGKGLQADRGAHRRRQGRAGALACAAEQQGRAGQRTTTDAQQRRERWLQAQTTRA